MIGSVIIGFSIATVLYKWARIICSAFSKNPNEEEASKRLQTHLVLWDILYNIRTSFGSAAYFVPLNSCCIIKTCLTLSGQAPVACVSTKINSVPGSSLGPQVGMLTVGLPSLSFFYCITLMSCFKLLHFVMSLLLSYLEAVDWAPHSGGKKMSAVWSESSALPGCDGWHRADGAAVGFVRQVCPQLVLFAGN